MKEIKLDKIAHVRNIFESIIIKLGNHNSDHIKLNFDKDLIASVEFVNKNDNVAKQWIMERIEHIENDHNKDAILKKEEFYFLSYFMLNLIEKEFHSSVKRNDSLSK